MGHTDQTQATSLRDSSSLHSEERRMPRAVHHYCRRPIAPHHVVFPSQPLFPCSCCLVDQNGNKREVYMVSQVRTGSESIPRFARSHRADIALASESHRVDIDIGSRFDRTVFRGQNSLRDGRQIGHQILRQMSCCRGAPHTSNAQNV